MDFGKFFGKRTAANQPQISDEQLKNQIVINTISDGIATIDARGIITLFNPAAAELTGWQQDEAVGLDARTIFKLLNKSKQQIDENKNPIFQTLKSGESCASENFLLATKSGKDFLAHLQATPVIETRTLTEDEKKAAQNLAVANADAEQKILRGVVVTFRDITREKADQNAQTDFISTASHEMRTPVAIIEGYLGMLLNPATATIDARAKTYAEKAHEAAQHLGHLFQDLLDVTKADDQRFSTNLVLIDAAVAAQNLVQDFAAKARAKNLSLIYSEPGVTDADSSVIAPRHVIYADLDQLNEILANLLENAIKYTKSGGVEMIVSEKNSRVRFSIKDSGIGIPAEDMPHLFQKFYRVDNSDTREIGGTGLGLYLIKKLAENLGGTINVESEYGRGSTFSVEFPALDQSEIIQKAQEIKQRARK